MTFTGKLIHEETAEDWDENERSGEWQNVGGAVQTLGFTMNAIDRLREVLAPLIKITRGEDGTLYNKVKNIHDYGCGLGEGAAALKCAFPMTKIKGIDFSPEKIRVAKERWPTIDFEVGDINDPKEFADIIWTSHTIEHQKDPAATIQRLLEYCHLLIVLFPWVTETHDGNHTGAEPTEQWLKRLPAPAYGVQNNYMLREVPESCWLEYNFTPTHDNQRLHLIENNTIFVWKS